VTRDRTSPATGTALLVFGVVMGILLMGVAYFRTPAADLGISDVLIGVTLVVAAVGLMTALFIVALRTVPRSRRPLLWSIALLLFLLTAFILLFAYTYLSLETTYPGSVPGIVTHLDSLYFTVTMLATVGFGDIVPVSEVARGVATVQMLLNLVLLGAVARIGVSVGRQAAERRVRAGEPLGGGPLRRVAAQWETAETQGASSEKGTT
jgi:voltage-gated potassium channel Kch